MTTSNLRLNLVDTRVNPYLYGYLAIPVLFCAQIVTGTGPWFALGVSVFALLTIQALKAAGGFATLTGICIGFLACQNVLISQVAKVVLDQPADTPLFQPLATIGVYDLTMAGIWVGALTIRRLTFQAKRPLAPRTTDPVFLFRLSLVSLALAFVQQAASHIFGVDSNTGAANTGGAIGPLKVLGCLPFLAISSSTAYTIVSSGGKRCLSAVSFVALALPTFFGFVGAGRTGMAFPFLTFLATCIAYRFRIKAAHVVLIVFLAVFAQFILAPFALYARSVARTPSMMVNIGRAADAFVEVLEHPFEFQDQNRIDESKIPMANQHFWYYGRPMSTLDRMSLICTADGIVDATINYGTSGMDTIQPGINMLLPRFLNPDKQVTTPGNLLAHRTVGLVGKHDTVTGISLGFACDAFSSYGWIGTPIIAYLITVLLFGIHSRVVDLRLEYNVYSLALIASLPWGFSDTGIAGQVLTIFQGPLIIAVAFWFLFRIARNETLLPVPRAAVTVTSNMRDVNPTVQSAR